MLSKATKYAIKAIGYLNKNPERKVGIKEISEKTDVPFAFIGKILQDLVRKDIISSSKGPNGGFYLSEDHKKNKMICIIEAIEGIDKFEECFLGHKGCDKDNPCDIHNSYFSFKNDLFTELSTKTISEIT